jgi:hypothetical protein
MDEQSEMQLRPGVTLDVEEVVKIACALKSLAAYTALACEHDDDPEDLERLVDQGLMAIDRLFEY